MNKNICVFCSSGDILEAKYYILAKNLAELIANGKNNLVFGGSKVGMMRILAEHIKKNNGKAIGVIPQKIYDNNLACEILDELIITKDMHSRKSKMAKLADAFIALPGGFGTLEELTEVITHKQLGYHSNPVIIINLDGFYDRLIDFFEEMYSQSFAKTVYRKLYITVNSAEEAMEYIKNYKPPVLENKWFVPNPNQNL
ncbi:MAG: TIGR00730 family Rossman fold protein [Bacteroidota bacterium]|nr:TIGR00730 family Rossman fold protein [Bacteroidota bacterium]